MKAFGTLIVREILGRNGSFNVADLITKFGEFSVRESLLDQLCAGTYQCHTTIEKIFLDQYVSNGRGITYVRAKVSHLRIDKASGNQVSEVSLIARDSEIDEVTSDVKPSALPAPPLELAVRSASDGPDFKLFGELMRQISAQEGVRLDSTLDRCKLRQQVGRLIELGYKFDLKKQLWFKADVREGVTT